MERPNPSQRSENNDWMEQLAGTLTELNTALEHIHYMYHTAQDLGLFSKKGGAVQSITGLLKSIDYQQLMQVAQSPMVQQLLTDPELLKLFMPDQASPSQDIQEPSHQEESNQNSFSTNEIEEEQAPDNL
jgi:hypothetical protein